AGRAALVFAGEFAGALNVPVHVVHVVDGPGSPAASKVSDRTTERDPDIERQRVADALVGRPEHGVEAALGHIVSGSVARNVLRHSRRPVVVVPEYGGSR
ncbi:MAG: hypothetical protein ACRDT5_24130, partial [Mycobacterium sp.]